MTLYYFQTQSTKALAHPPDLSRRRDLEEEDLFIHKYGGDDDDPQFWIWINEEGRGLQWKRVYVGYRRPSDGRHLTLTPKRRDPSWLETSWYLTRLRQSKSFNIVFTAKSELLADRL